MHDIQDARRPENPKNTGDAPWAVISSTVSDRYNGCNIMRSMYGKHSIFNTQSPQPERLITALLRRYLCRAPNIALVHVRLGCQRTLQPLIRAIPRPTTLNTHLSRYPS